jgi:hypothetical protein
MRQGDGVTLWVCGLAVGVVAACATSPAPVRPAPGASARVQADAPPRPAGQAALAGMYTVTLTAADQVQPVMFGRWTLRLGGDGRYEVGHDGESVVRGSYTVSGDRLTFVNDGGIMSCGASGAAAGSYEWSLRGDQLTFVDGTDQCEARRAITVRLWAREPRSGM